MAKKVEFDPSEGLYYEKVFSPEKVEVFKDPTAIIQGKVGIGKQPTKKLRFQTRLVLSDKRGHKLEVKGRRLVHRVMQYLQPWASLGSVGVLADLEENQPDKLQDTLTRAAKKAKRQLKTYFDDKGELHGIASTIHQQISWARIRELVEGAVKKAYRVVDTPEVVQPAANKWTYRMPIQDKHNNVSAWVTVDGGKIFAKPKDPLASQE